MKAFKRICLKDTPVPNGGDVFWLKRATEYTTSAEKNGKVCVFCQYWFWWDVSIFGGAEELT